MTGLLVGASRDFRWSRASEAGVVALLVAGAAIANPDHPLPIDLCGFKHLTGLPCPTCGLTRAACHALRGHWAQSVAYHPAGVIVVALLVGWIVWSSAEAAGGRPLRQQMRGRLTNASLGVCAALALVSWVVRLVSGSWPA